MADGLAGVLAGGGPLGPAEMQAQMWGAGAMDPRTLASSAGPVGQAIGQLTATLAARPQAMAAAQQVAAAQTAAMGDLSAAYASDDPYKWVSDNPNASPVARWSILRSTPEQVAQTKQSIAQAALLRAQTIRPEAFGTLLRSGETGVPTLPAAVGGAPIRTATAGGGDPTAGIPQLQGAGPSPDPLSGMPAAGPARFAWLQKQPVALQRQAIARMRSPQVAQK